jgi:hypothetical protein
MRRKVESKQGCVMSESYTAIDALLPILLACCQQLLLACMFVTRDTVCHLRLFIAPETLFVNRFVSDERRSWTEVPLYLMQCDSQKLLEKLVVSFFPSTKSYCLLCLRERGHVMSLFHCTWGSFILHTIQRSDRSCYAEEAKMLCMHFENCYCPPLYKKGVVTLGFVGSKGVLRVMIK